MYRGIIILPTLALCGWCIWVRRKTWRWHWDRAITMVIVFQTLAFLLVLPVKHNWLGRTLFWLTGIAHLRDYFGDILFICALSCMIYALAGRLAPDGDLEPFMHRIEIPGAIAAAAMLASMTLSKNLKKPPPPDFFDVPVDFWLGVYWTTYVTLIGYLMWIAFGLLLQLRADPRSRSTVNMFVVALGFGGLSFAVLLMRIYVGRVIPCTWIWTPMCIAAGLASLVAARSWVGRMRGRDGLHPGAVGD